MPAPTSPLQHVPMASSRAGAFVPLLVMVLAGITLAFSQREWINADLVAYASVAHRLLDAPCTSVTGCWSPLLSWLMVPLLLLGIDDVVAARSVLIASGVLYLAAWQRLAHHWLPGAERAFARTALVVCALLQAVLWSGSMVTADLVGNACLFTGLAVLARPGALTQNGSLVRAGVWFGLAYLGKAYMLTFAIPALPLVVAWLVHAPGGKPAHGRALPIWVRATAVAGATMLLVAAPWIAVLSDTYDRFTIAEVGSTHHANVGPGQGNRDPMWNPPLGVHYVLHFAYGPDWSPFASWTNFCHQVALVAKNSLRLLGHVSGWVAFTLVAAVAYWRARRRGESPTTTAPPALLGLAALWTLLYPLGYLLIDTERRYVIPTMAPMLCLLALGTWPRLATRQHGVAFGLLLGLLFGWQELRLCWIAGTHHNQMMARPPLAATAALLREQGHATTPFAASSYHAGLGVAYLAGSQDHYLGRPLATDADARDRELRAAGVQCYLAYERDAVRPLPANWCELGAHDIGTTDAVALPRIFVRTD